MGRTDLADFCVADDDQLADVHFAVRCDADDCTVRGLAAGAPTLLNDEAIDAETPLRDGATITAGGTRFDVRIEGELSRATQKASILGGDDGEDPTAAVVSRIAQVAQQAELSDAARSLVVGQRSPVDVLAALSAAQLRDDAVSFLAYWFAPREAVWWARMCVSRALGDTPTPAQQKALDAARAWLVEASEENRVAALAAAGDRQAGTMAAWVARCAVWNSNNLSGEELPVVPPPVGLGGKAVASTLKIAVAAAPQDQLEARCDEFVDFGKSILLGQEQLPQA